MARSAFTAPAHVVLQRSPGQFGSGSSVSPDAAPSLSYGGAGILDHRMAYNRYNNVAAGTITGGAALGWATDGLVCTLDQVPATISAGSIAPAANAATGAMALVSSSAAGTIILSTAFTSLPFFTVIPATVGTTGPLACATNPVYSSLGARDRTLFYDPTTALTRAVQVTGSTSAVGGTFTVLGWDYYGQVQTEVITHPGGTGATAGKKTFKWIKSVTTGFTDAHNYSVEWTDVFGFHIGVDRFAFMDTYFNDALVNSPAFVAADATSPATSTTLDVRGTVGPTNITSNGTKRLQLFAAPSSARITAANLAVGLFGVVPA